MNPDLFRTMFIGNDKTWERMTSALKSEDDIGVVLRIHLLTENMLEAFCCAASNNQKFFDGFGESLNMSYAAKLKLALNFGLSEFSYNELKLVNKIRNARAHKIDNAEISDKEIEDLMKLIRKGGQEDLVDSKPFGIMVDDKKIFLNDPNNSNRDKFIAVFGAIVYRVTSLVNQ